MKILRIIVISNILLNIIGCKQSEETVPLKGNIVGFVSLIDENGNEVIDKSDVTVTLENINKSTITNEDGRYEIKNVPAGTYSLTYSKNNYGSYKRYNFQHVGGNISNLAYKTRLYEQPDIEISNLDISYDGQYINIAGDITEKNHYSYQIFFNDNANVSYLNYGYTPGTYSSCCLNENQFWFSIDLSYLPYKQGDTIYLVIYFINPNEEMGYYDYESDQYIYSSYKKVSDEIEFTLE